jgi:soluble lytic murein transglycosylase-like protein
MVTPASVSRWEPVIVAELHARSIPLPKELVESIMTVESRGKPGLVNPKSGASGLMQVMPTTLQDFNQRNGTDYTLSDMRGTSADAATKQIRVGIDIMAHYWQRAYQYLSTRLGDVPIDELGRIADLFYVAGPGATRKKLDKLDVPVWERIKTAYPNWNALPHPTKVFSDPKPWNVNAISQWLEGSLSDLPIEKDPKKGFGIGIVILMLAYWYMSKGKKT